MVASFPGIPLRSRLEMNDQRYSRVQHQDGRVPDVMCHGGRELSESRHGEGGADGQRPETDTPETRNTSAEELSNSATPGDGVPAPEESRSTRETPGKAQEAEEGPEGPSEPEFIGPVSFKTSGSFFREKVARNLAEQGYGGLGAQDENASSSDSQSPEDVADDPPSPASAPTEPISLDAVRAEASAEPREPEVEGSEDAGEAREEVTESAGGGTRVEDSAETVPGGGDTPVDDAPTVAMSTDAIEAAAVADHGPEAETGGGSDSVSDERTGAEEREPAEERTEPETVRSPAVGTVTGAASSASDTPTSADTERIATGTGDESTTAETEALWPQPRRLSDYVSETPDPEKASQDTGAGTTESATEGTDTTGAAGATTTVFSLGSQDGPRTEASPASGGHGGEDEGTAPQAPRDSHAASSAAQSGSHVPGGPKGPSGPGGTGPGGPRGPGAPKGRKGSGAKKPLWWRMLRVFLVVTGLFVIIACGTFAYLYFTVEVPDAAKADALEQGSTFYYADGETEFAYRGTNREILAYEEMTEGGDHIVEAVISAEDRGFWTEPGVSLSGTTRAFWSTVTGKQVQGGSTITQQMVRNYYEGVSRDVSIARKIQEIIISIKVDQSESKEWVMQQYLNTIYFGRNAYGIQAAAEAYYHKDVQDLEPAEAAFLAAAIQQPSWFGEADVETTPAMERRWEYVVNGMVTTGAITQAEADQMEFPAPEAERPAEGNDLSGYKGYMLQEAVNELERLGYTEDQINRQGYSIVTTFDKDMMDAAYEVVEETVPPENVPEGVNIGLTTIDPKTGEVLAFYGGRDYWENQYDSAFLGAAQTGSAFKPYVLATALEQGYSLHSTVDGRGPRDIQGARIQNAGNSPGGVMDLVQATRVSNNLGYVELAQEVGFEKIRDTIYDAGWPEGSIPDSQLVPVMPLGAASARPVDQATGYATFANGGVHTETHVVKEIINTKGEDERPEIESTRVLEESTAADVTHALEQVVNGGTGTAARLWDHPVAGKTGTTNDSVAAWFVGYTPQLSTAVAVYSGDNQSFSIPGHNISGGGMPATLWNRYMSRAMEGYERGSFPSPAFGGTTENWAPEPSPVEPEQPQQDDQPQSPVEPETPVQPEQPEPPIEPEPGDPGPEIPSFPGPGPGEDDGGWGGGGDGWGPPGRGDEDG